MNATLATQPVIAADSFGALPPFRSGRKDLAIGYGLYMDGKPIDDCDGLLQRRGYWQANRDEAMATMPVEVTL